MQGRWHIGPRKYRALPTMSVRPQESLISNSKEPARRDCHLTLIKRSMSKVRCTYHTDGDIEDTYSTIHGKIIKMISNSANAGSAKEEFSGDIKVMSNAPNPSRYLRSSGFVGEKFSEFVCHIVLIEIFRMNDVRFCVGEQLDNSTAAQSSMEKIQVGVRSWSDLLWILLNPRLRIGESYQTHIIWMVQGDLSDFISTLFTVERSICKFLPMRIINAIIRSRFKKDQRYGIEHSKSNVHKHYDVGNDFYEAFLDRKMVYSCALFEDEKDNLESAQINKMRLALGRARVSPNGRFLEIGCGWGALSVLASEMGAAEVVGLTLSEEQRNYCESSKSLTDRHIVFHLQDYRQHATQRQGYYDSIASLGMFEHVGIGQFDEYFKSISLLLKRGGRALIHTIVRPEEGVTNAWIERYVFPGGYIASIREIETAISHQSDLRLEVVHKHMGHHYERTLIEWRRRLSKNKKALLMKYDEYLLNTYEFYLAGSEAAFSKNGLSIAQFEITKI